MNSISWFTVFKPLGKNKIIIMIIIFFNNKHNGTGLFMEINFSPRG